MRSDYLRLCLCSGLGGKVADDWEMGPASWGQQSAGCRMGRYGSRDNAYMKLLLEFICSWCYYLFVKKMKFAYPRVSLKSSHPIMARKNTRIIVSINRDNDSNLLWQKQRKSNSVLDLPPLKTWMPISSVQLSLLLHPVTELMKLTDHNNILIEDANISDLRRFHFNVFCLLNRSLNLQYLKVTQVEV